jgi:hypothetical protein
MEKGLRPLFFYNRPAKTEDCMSISASVVLASLLTAAGQAQLQAWLGRPAQLTQVYVMQPGDTAAQFHAAADGKGATIALLRVGDGTHSWLVGGYNPQSWASSNRWNETVTDPERTAFIFNLGAGSVYRQVPATYILPSLGQKQTYNGIDSGPAFGEGRDLAVDGELKHAYSWLMSYGDPLLQGMSMIDGSYPGPLPHLLRLQALEVYAVSPVPEPHSAVMLLAGLGILAMFKRRSQ